MWCCSVILKYLEAVARRCFIKKMFLQISQNSQENTCIRVSLVVKPETLVKKSPTQMSFRGFREISKNIYFVEHLRPAASEYQ